jgi:4-hydroxy-tetrahydrodipicolinate reductase
MVSINVVGARGRMGKALIQAIMSSDDLTLGSAVDRSGGPGIGQDAGKIAGLPPLGVLITDELTPRRNSVVVDFSLPEATARNIRICHERGVALVLGTTGIGPETEELLQEAAKAIPVVFAANFSVGVTVLTQIAAIAARALGPRWDAELVELHHRHKRDAPSGTALRIGHAVARATDRDFAETVVTSRTGTNQPRETQEIGVIGLRGGDSVGEHTLMFLTEGERIELIHRAGERGIFARGALRAARWACSAEPGLYDMVDVLGMNDVT